MSRTQDKRIWMGGGIAVAVLIAVIAWFAAISPQLSGASTTRADTDTARLRNNVLESANADLKRQSDDIAALRGQLRTALIALPDDGGLPDFTRQVSQQAAANHVTVTSVVVGAASPVVAAGPSAGTAATTTTPTPPIPAVPAAAGALVSIPVSLVSTGKGADQLAFLKAIQAAGSRRALVTATQLAPLVGKNNDGGTTMTLQLTIFSAPVDAAGRAALDKLVGK